VQEPNIVKASNRTPTDRSRGALSNEQSRFIATRSEPIDDGWAAPNADSCSSLQPDIGPDPSYEAEFAVRRVKTEFFADKTRTLITRNSSPDIPFDRSINPYKGCEHGCIYCYARPTHAYLDLSPGLDFERKIFYKTQVTEHLANEFAKPGYQVRPIAIGTNTDPYQPGEKQHQVMRELLTRLLAHRHPVTIVTKGQLLTRDLDLLSQLAELNLVKVMISVTTLSTVLKTKLEPRTASPGVRLKMMQQLAEAGVPVGAMVAPVIPHINDAELQDIVAACVAHGAKELNYILLRLPLEVAPLFEQWLAEHYPLRAAKVMNVIRDTRGGKAYDAQWGRRMRGQGPFAELLAQRFALALKQHPVVGGGIASLNCGDFLPDPKRSQLALF
jgi:DNA repair photolyase